MFLGGVRTRLFLLVLLALLPGLGLILHTGLEQRRQLDAGARGEVDRLARLVAEHQQRALDTGRGVLVGLAHMPGAQGSAEECSEAAREILEHFPGVANLGVLDLQGTVFCSARPLPHRVSGVDRPWFRRAIAERRFTVGGYQMSRTTLRPTVNLAYPAEAHGGLHGVVFGGIDLQTIQEQLAALGLPADAVVMVTDRDGVVLARWPEPGAWVGVAHEGALGELLLAREARVVEASDLDGVQRVFALRPVTLDESGETALLVAAGVDAAAARAPATALLRRTLAAYLAASLAALLAALVVGELALARPLARIMEAARRLAAGDAGARAGLTGATGEVRELAAAFDRMADAVAERGRLEEQLRQAQKMEAVGQLAGGIAHDFNNLLTVILSFGRCVRADLPEDHPSRADVDEILSSAQRAAELTKQLLAFSRRQVVERRPIELASVVRDLEPMLRRVIGEDVALSFETPSACAVEADPGVLTQVLLNLAVNARDAMPDGGRLTIAARALSPGDPELAADPTLPPGPLGALSVTDTGVGMEPATAARAFEPFFTTKPLGKGTGLGLAIVYGAATQLGGAVRVRTAPGRGSTFTVYLPCLAGGAAEHGPRRASSPAGQARAPEGRGESILVVEDDDAVRAVEVRVLARAGYRVHAAARADEAVAWAAGSVELDLLLTDVILPGESGPALAARLVRERPHVAVVFVSGYTGGHLAADDLVASGARLVTKPFAEEALLAAVREALDARGHRAA